MNHRRALLPALLLLALLSVAIGRAATPAAATRLFLPLVVQPGASTLTPEEQAVLDAVNKARVEAGCPALAVSPALQTAAHGHSQGMATRNFFGHTDPDGNNAIKRTEAAGYASKYVGENVAAGQASAQRVMDDWMNSAAHRPSIFNCKYTETGIGYAFDANDQLKIEVDGRLVGPFFHYWTQVFGNPSL